MSLLMLWFLMTAPMADPAPPPTAAGRAYKTTKTRPMLEKCLYNELSDLGDATFMRSEAETILMVRNGQGPPLLVDIAPPRVQITTRADPDVQIRVKRCV